MQLRWYQNEAVDAAYDHLCHDEGNPVICMPTGSGKSVVIAELARRAIEKFDGRVMVLQHRKELIEQNAAKLRSVMPGLDIGIYSAGLSSRDTEHRVVFAGIQSIYNKVHLLAPRQLVIVDEVHLVPSDGEGMYRTLFGDLAQINRHRVVGLTATPFRTGEGSICGRNRMFNKICYNVPIGQLIAEGFLCPVTNKAADGTRDTSGLHKRAGEFITSEVDTLFGSVLQEACKEIEAKTVDRHSVMIFCSSVGHAQQVCDLLPDCHMVEGNTPPLERAAILKAFGEGKVKYLANCDVLTTGFDAPVVDAIAALRATASPGLFAQIVGRGLRTHPSKKDCLLLDFGENLKRHGPIDRVDYNQRGARTAKGIDADAPTKKCPNCDEELPIQARECMECGFTYPQREAKHATVADEQSQVISEPVEFEVRQAVATVHEKEGKIPSMRVTYTCYRDSEGNLPEHISEWVCLGHQGFARKKAIAWWHDHAATEVPTTAEEGVKQFREGYVATPKSIVAIRDGKWWRVVEREIEEVPDPMLMCGFTNEEMPF